MKLKAQVSAEFIIVFIILLLALTITTAVSYQRVDDLNFQKKELESERLLNRLSNKIDTALLEGSGFSTNITMPGTVIGYNYTMNISSGYIYLVVDDMTFFSKLLTENVTGVPRKGTNRISNENMMIVIT